MNITKRSATVFGELLKVPAHSGLKADVGCYLRSRIFTLDGKSKPRVHTESVSPSHHRVRAEIHVRRRSIIEPLPLEFILAFALPGKARLQRHREFLPFENNRTQPGMPRNVVCEIIIVPPLPTHGYLHPGIYKKTLPLQVHIAADDEIHATRAEREIVPVHPA